MPNLGNATYANVSAYQRTRDVLCNVRHGEQRDLVCNFNGAIPVGVSLVWAKWSSTQTSGTAMSMPLASNRNTQVTIQAGYGRSFIRCQATMTDGSVLNQVFRVWAVGGPYFQGDQNPVSGPAELIAVNPEQEEMMGDI